MLPSRFREVLRTHYDDLRVVITKHPTDPCLVVYPLKEWEKFEARVRELPTFNKQAKLLRRVYVGCAQDCDVDKQGRLLVPADLRARGEIDTDVVWKGQISFAELWSKDRYDAEVEPAIARLESGELPELEQALEDLGL